jgi:hypothetical protein
MGECESIGGVRCGMWGWEQPGRDYARQVKRHPWTTWTTHWFHRRAPTHLYTVHTKRCRLVFSNAPVDTSCPARTICVVCCRLVSLGSTTCISGGRRLTCHVLHAHLEVRQDLSMRTVGPIGARHARRVPMRVAAPNPPQSSSLEFRLTQRK